MEENNVERVALDTLAAVEKAAKVVALARGRDVSVVSSARHAVI